MRASDEEGRITSQDEDRSVDEICMPELRALAAEVLDGDRTEPDPVVSMARLAGLGRMRAPSRHRLEQALQLEQEARDSTSQE